MNPPAESNSFGDNPLLSCSVFSYTSLPTTVDEDASDLRHSPSAPSVFEENIDGADPTVQSLSSSDSSRRNSISDVDDQLELRPGRGSAEVFAGASAIPFRPAVASAIEQIRHGSTSSRWRGIASNWYFELLWCLVSAACFLVLVLLLKRYNNQPIPKWPLGLTINTAIALLATVSRTAFVIPVCESISQMKWLWYKKERPLADLQAFDEASRGPWGSLKLLVTMCTKSWLLALLPALVMTTSVLTSTLTQSVVTYPTRLEPVPGLPEPSLYRAADLYGMEVKLDKINPRIFSDIFTGLYYPIDDELEIIQPSCATGKCRWPLFDTIEVCTKTWNITEHLSVGVSDGRITNFSLPNGAFLRAGEDKRSSNSDELLWLSSGHSPVSYTANSSSSTNTTISNHMIVYSTSFYDGGKPPSAYEVVFYHCVKRYNVTVNENVVSRQQNKSSTQTDHGPVKVLHYEDLLVNTTYIFSPGDKEIKFPIGLQEQLQVKSALKEMLNGTYIIDPDGLSEGPTAHLSNLMREAYGSGKDRRPDGVRDVTIPDAAMETVANVSRNIAASLSKAIINLGNSYWGMEIENTVQGENLGPVTFVEVRWPWLLLLGLQILFSVIFVTIIITRTELSNLGVTKSSLLPILFAINPEERGLVEKNTGMYEHKYHQEFTKVANGATGVVGRFRPGMMGRGWILREPKGEM